MQAATPNGNWATKFTDMKGCLQRAQMHQTKLEPLSLTILVDPTYAYAEL